MDSSIRSRCKVNTNVDTDTFVGLQCLDGDISITFPLGFDISTDDNGLKNDIFLLFKTLRLNTKHQESTLLKQQSQKFDNVNFPIQSYLFIINDFLSKGYYTESEINYKVGGSGKINWNRSIKTQHPYIDNNNVFYLNFVTRRSRINDSLLITLIHEYFVFESFSKLGFLFNNYIPKKPEIKKDANLFKAILGDKLTKTFNDRNVSLFRNMLAILDSEGDSNSNTTFRYGTNRFEYVWEEMIDNVFGIRNKSDFFPKTSWNIQNRIHDNASLEPDSIMLFGNDIYILDSKYYKYGVTKIPSHLPESTSINKQITYGEYVSSQKTRNGEDVFNAFILPYNGSKQTNMIAKEKIGYATGNWKINNKNYEKVAAILIDVKSLMKKGTQQDHKEIESLANLIRS